MITLGFNQKPVHARRARPRIDLFMRMCENIALFMQENDGRDFKAFLVRDHGFDQPLPHDHGKNLRL